MGARRPTQQSFRFPFACRSDSQIAGPALRTDRAFDVSLGSIQSFANHHKKSSIESSNDSSPASESISFIISSLSRIFGRILGLSRESCVSQRIAREEIGASEPTLLQSAKSRSGFRNVRDIHWRASERPEIVVVNRMKRTLNS